MASSPSWARRREDRSAAGAQPIPGPPGVGMVRSNRCSTPPLPAVPPRQAPFYQSYPRPPMIVSAVYRSNQEYAGTELHTVVAESVYQICDVLVFQPPMANQWKMFWLGWPARCGPPVTS